MSRRVPASKPKAVAWSDPQRRRFAAYGRGVIDERSSRSHPQRPLRTLVERLRISSKIRIIRKLGANDMVKVSSAEFQKNIGRYQDVALVQPVTITRNGRERTVMISAEEYHRLKRRDRQVLGLDDFTEADLAAIRAAEPPAETAHFDDELK